MAVLSCLGECSFVAVLLNITVLLGIIYYLKSRRPRNFPPGPRGLPIVGSVPFFRQNIAENLMEMKSKYGPVMSVQIGTDDWIILNDFESINEALVKKADKFSGRPTNFMFQIVSGGDGGAGITFLDYGQTWRNLRKFGLMTLRGFGVGKKGMEENVEEEIPFLVESLLNDSDTLSVKLSRAVSNIICRVVFGSRFEYHDRRFSLLVGLLREYFSGGSFGSKLFGILVLAPQLRHIPPFSGAVRKVYADNDKFLDIVRELIEEHKERFDENDIRDVTDAFLREIKTTGEDDKDFTEDRALQFIRDLFDAGTVTTSTTLSWAVLCFANHPECQEKIHEEIVKTIGDSRSPSMKDRDTMPYTCAFIQELMRHRTLAPLGVFHKTNSQATLAGYTIPENTWVATNIWAVHMNPEQFKNPSEFRPERFLDSSGKFVRSNHVIPFSLGPRHCLGEQLANMEIFIFITGIVQKLKLLPNPSNPPPSFEHSGIVTLVTFDAPDFSVKFERR